MNFRFTLVLLVVAILAIAGFGIAQKQLPAPVPTATATPQILNVSSSDVTSLDVKTKGHETDLVKSGSKWQLVKPVQDQNVDQSKVDGLVGQLSTLTGTRTVAQSNVDLQPYGLKDPAVTVAVKSSGNKTDTLLIGNKTIDGNNYYAMTQGGSNVQLISNSVVNGLTGIANTPPQATPTPTPTITPTPMPTPLVQPGSASPSA